MEQGSKDTQKMSVYFPIVLLERVRESAKLHRRSFNQEALWLIEKGLEQKGGQKDADQQKDQA
jgi:hypothetical protein